MTGCAGRKARAGSTAAGRAGSGQSGVVITPASSASGRVASVNPELRFVVVTFPVGQVPANETVFAVFRAGAKVGTVKISGPAADTYTVGDITAGSAQKDDEVRAE